VTNRLGEVELELRLLPGVVNVGLGSPEPSGHVAVTLVVLDPEPDLEETATRVARSLHSAATVEVVDLSPPPPHNQGTARLVAPDERVALVASSVDESGEASVELSWRGSAARASGSGGPLIGTAKATLGALRGLGIDLEAGLGSVSTGRGVTNSPVRVILRAERSETEFVGIAQAGSAQESTARATLAAFNRYAAQNHGVAA
jgi:hypothetical protein